MNQFALRMFVRSIIAEAKEKKAKDEPKKAVKKAEPKKAEKKEPKKAKASNLVEAKESLASKKDELKATQELIGALSSISNDNTYQDVEIFGDILDNVMKDIEDLKKKEEELKKEISSLEETITTEISKIKEMMGLTSKDKDKKKMMDEKKEDYGYGDEPKADKDIPMTTEAKKMTSAQKNKKEDIVKGMKKSGGFGKSKEEKSKMYATATKLATKK